MPSAAPRGEAGRGSDGPVPTVLPPTPRCWLDRLTFRDALRSRRWPCALQVPDDPTGYPPSISGQVFDRVLLLSSGFFIFFLMQSKWSWILLARTVSPEFFRFPVEFQDIDPVCKANRSCLRGLRFERKQPCH